MMNEKNKTLWFDFVQFEWVCRFTTIIIIIIIIIIVTTTTTVLIIIIDRPHEGIHTPSPKFSLGKTIPFHMIPRVLYNHILIITKTTTATTKNVTTTNVVIITITIQTALIIIIISLPQPLGCDNVKST